MTTWTTRQLAEEAVQAGRPVTQEYIRQLCKSGALQAEKPGRDWLIRGLDARRWLEDWLNKIKR